MIEWNTPTDSSIKDQRSTLLTLCLYKTLNGFKCQSRTVSLLRESPHNRGIVYGIGNPKKRVRENDSAFLNIKIVQIYI